MKNILLYLSLWVAISAHAQNHFPATGNVGIGTGSDPRSTLEVKGESPSIGITSTTTRGGMLSFSYEGMPNRGVHFGYIPNRQGLLCTNNGRPVFMFTNDTLDMYKPDIFGFFNARDGIMVEIIAPHRVDVDGNRAHHLPGLIINGVGDHRNEYLEIGIGNTAWLGTGKVLGTVAKGAEHKLRLTSHIRIAPRDNYFHLFDIDNNEENIFHVDRERASFHRPVGIGTSTFPIDEKYQLYVKGGIVTENVKVNLAAERGWGDFVFEQDYVLKPLQEVEDFISTNKHLPEIPSAKQIGEEGLELSEMVRLQMIKIEELTLYIIEQNKRLEAQEARLNEQSMQLKEQQAKMNRSLQKGKR